MMEIMIRKQHTASGEMELHIWDHCSIVSMWFDRYRIREHQLQCFDKEGILCASFRELVNMKAKPGYELIAVIE